MPVHVLTESEYRDFLQIRTWVRGFSVSGGGATFKSTPSGASLSLPAAIDAATLRRLLEKNPNGFTGQTIRSWGLAIVGTTLQYYQATDYYSSGLLVSSSATGTVSLTGTNSCG